MITKHDYSYINKEELRLIELGFAEYDIYHLHFDYRHGEREFNNRQLNKIEEYLKEKYSVYQLNTESKNAELFWYSNKGWNNKETYDFFNISMNNKNENTTDENIKFLSEFVDDIPDLNLPNIQCRIQYTLRLSDNISEKAKVIVESLQGKWIEYNGMTGKLKLVGEQVAFFKKRAKSRYYAISDKEVVLNWNQ